MSNDSVAFNQGEADLYEKRKKQALISYLLIKLESPHDNIAEHRLLQGLLVLCMPYNEAELLAERLLKHYYNLSNVLVAPIEELFNFAGDKYIDAMILIALAHACVCKISWENLA